MNNTILLGYKAYELLKAGKASLHFVNLVSSAFTHIEFNGSFDNYRNDPLNWSNDVELEKSWRAVVNDYAILSSMMCDEVIKMCQDVIMEEY